MRGRELMYLEYFGLSEAPFSITPDPGFVYLSQRHRDALAHLLYGVGQGGSGGFVQLTGEVGTGKTTLCRCLLEQVPEGTRIALVLNPLMSPRELLAAICEELRIDTTGIEDSSKALVDRLNQELLAAHAAGERVVVVIDEAQNLSPESLEQVRLLTNLETHKQKLLQIVLLGQPELRQLLQRQSLRQLAQRITARYHLTPLGREDTARYVRHRMQVAGARHNPFRRAAMRALFQRSSGIPRLINIIADRALVAAYAREREDIDARMVHAAADEVQLGEPGARRAWWPWAAAATAGILLALIAWQALRGPAEVPAEPVQAAQQAGPVATPQVAPARAEPTPPPRLDENWLEVQHQAAWQGLAAAWNDPGAAAAIEQACAAGRAGGWACLQQTGSFARIEQLGLPVVMQLTGETPRLLMLQGVDGERLLAGAPGTERTVPREALERQWFGGYFVAWPQAATWPREIRRGDTGPAVQTVLSLAGEADLPYRGAPVFGREFESWLQAYQQRHALDADGIVGPRTLLYLMRPSITSPALRRQWTEET
ncbi:MAG: AAA family ATPase [Xanthomonadales bacterium]|nr:AAA family ATPase [Xanthomonadales bacterium]